MRFGIESNRDEFLDMHGFNHLLNAKQMPGKNRLRYFFEKEDHTRSLFTIAKYLATMSAESATTLVVLDNMYIWASGRDEHLIRVVLQSMTDQELDRVTDGAMFVWERCEAEKAATLYHLAFLFGWDAYIYPSCGDASAFVCHDGFVEIYIDAEPEAYAVKVEGQTSRNFQVVGTQGQ